jgi:CheY-like chemotaxis protein
LSPAALDLTIAPDWMPEPRERETQHMTTVSDAPRILIVDDYGDLVATMGELIQDAGYEVTLTTSGHTAMQLHRQRPYDLVITDIFMPEVDGIELILDLRQADRRVKIMAMSAGGQRFKALAKEEYLLIAQAHGADRTMPKPIDGRALITAIRELLAA